MTRVFIWGAGRCGRTLAQALHEAGHSVIGTWNRSADAAAEFEDAPWPAFFGDTIPPSLCDAEVVWVTVLDDVISSIGPILGNGQIALHASGALPAAALRQNGANPRAVAACHPLQSFGTTDNGAQHIRGITFGIEGEPDAVAMAEQLVKSMEAHSFVVDGDTAKALYHAACCVASNAMVALADRAVNLFEAAGVSRAQGLRALSPLILGTALNLSQTDAAEQVLTGPIARGDSAVIERHLNAISERTPAELESYKHLAQEILRLAPNTAISKLIED